MTIRSTCLAFTAATLIAAALHAAPSYRFVTDRADNLFDASQGPVTVSVYLQELGAPSQIAGIGLDGAAFAVTRLAPGGAKIADLGFNPAFNAGPPFNTKLVTDGYAELTEASLVGSVGFDAVRSDCVFLGSITIAPDTGTLATQFTIDRYGSGGDIVTSAHTELDGSAGMGTTVTVVLPEPACLGLLAVAGLGRRRKR